MKQSFLLRSRVNSLVSPSCSSPMQSLISHLVGQCRALKNHERFLPFTNTPRGCHKKEV
jgi:hypothetical protein